MAYVTAMTLIRFYFFLFCFCLCVFHFFFLISTQMSSHDCFEMGRQSYLNKDYHHTALWMSEAIDRLHNNTNETTSISRADILEYLAFSIFKQGSTLCIHNLLRSNSIKLITKNKICIFLQETSERH